MDKRIEEIRERVSLEETGNGYDWNHAIKDIPYLLAHITHITTLGKGTTAALTAEVRSLQEKASHDYLIWYENVGRLSTALKRIEQYIYNLPEPDYCEELFHIQDIVREVLAAHSVPIERTKVEEAKNAPCPVCIARRGIDKCRPDEAFHVTHYDAEEMNMDPLPDKPCECGLKDTTAKEMLCDTCGRKHDPSWNCVTAARGCGGGGPGEPYGT